MLIRKASSGMGVAFMAAVLAFGLGSGAANAQGKRMIVMDDDGGSGPMIRHFSMPDLFSLREPDFARSDLPIFQEKLVLSEAQTEAVKRQIEVYLEALAKLTKEMLSFPGAEPMVFALGGGAGKGDGAAGEGGEAAFVVGSPVEGGFPEFSFDEMDGSEGMSLEIGVMVGGPDEDVEAGGEDMQPSVAISFQPSDGTELPEELRKELEKRAEEMAEKIKQQIEEQMANGGVAADGGHPGFGLPGGGDVTEMEKRQKEMEAATKSFRRAKSQLRDEFVMEAQSTLTKPQVDRWPALDRALLRERSLPKGRLSGERTNLFKVMKGLDLPMTDGKVAAQLDSYDLELDAALRQRNDAIAEADEKLDKAMQEKAFDRALTILDRASAARVAVRSVNERNAQAVKELLPAGSATAFQTAVLKNAYPQIYRQTFADKTFAAAAKMEGLDAGTRARIAELEQAYRVERTEMDATIRRTIDKSQPDEPRRPVEQMKAMMSGPRPAEPAEPGMIHIGDDKDPVREAMGKRRELDERYAKSVASLLTPEQQESLPKAPVRRKVGEPIIIRREAK